MTVGEVRGGERVVVRVLVCLFARPLYNHAIATCVVISINQGSASTLHVDPGIISINHV